MYHKVNKFIILSYTILEKEKKVVSS